jgi:hypothetical protein
MTPLQFEIWHHVTPMDKQLMVEFPYRIINTSDDIIGGVKYARDNFAEGSYHVRASRKFYFKDSSDATQFKLRWS